MGEVVDVSGPTEVVDDTVLVKFDGQEYVRLDSGDDQPQHPIQVKHRYYNQEKEDNIEKHDAKQHENRRVFQYFFGFSLKISLLASLKVQITCHTVNLFFTM